MDEPGPGGSPRLTLARWPETAPDPVPGGRAWTVVDLGGSDTTIDGWLRILAARELPTEVVKVENLAGFDPAALFAGRTVGWRLAAAGPEHAVLQLRAAALAAGLIDEELLLHATSAPRARVYCPHCTATVETRLPATGLHCPGCGVPLAVHPHVSLFSGRYLGSVTSG